MNLEHFKNLWDKSVKNGDMQVYEEDLRWFNTQPSALVSIHDPEYPLTLKSVASPPHILAVWGNVDVLQRDLLSVVGSRDPQPESIEWMETYIPELIKLGLVVVSGGARGIDQRAHSLSLRNQAPTVVVLPSGFRRLYPKDLEYWKDFIIGQGGCFVSELAPSVPMRSHYFHARNRIVVGLSKTLLLIEARRKSGSSMTARLASEASRTLCVVPGPPTRHAWGASTDLICQGAFCVRDAVDVWLLHSNSTLAVKV